MEKKEDKDSVSSEESKKSPKRNKVKEFLSSNESRNKIKGVADNIKRGKKKEQVFNIIYTIDKKRKYESETESESDYEEDEDYEESEEDEESEAESEESEEEEGNWTDKDILQFLENHQSKDPNNKTLQTFMDICQSKIKTREETREKNTKRNQKKNTELFRDLLKNKKNDDAIFFSELAVEEQEKHLEELRKINANSIVKKPHKIAVIESDIDPGIKSIALKKINSLRFMDPSSGEYHKLQHWVDGFMNIPFNQYKTLDVSIADGLEKCGDFMENSQKILNDCVYGLNDAKMQIMQMVGQFLSNPQSIGNAIAIKGPMGTGKTTLIKEGLSKIFNRPFAFIALGGASDGSHLEGHSFTYEGSNWGKIVQILIQSKCMNPVIFFDELDKISDTPKGEEITGILTHLTDTTQNSQFHDKFFSEIDFDLSKCLFIFSYNDESKINPILRDRMYSIGTKGYSRKEKIVIARQYLLPKIYEQVAMNPEDVLLDDSVLDYIVESRCKEEGVRNFKRCLETIFTKINLYRLLKPDTTLFEEKPLKVEFPLQVTKSVVDKLLKLDRSEFNALYI
jgi:ATP-dependent Lon protease